MSKDITSFLKNKQIEYKIVREDEFYDFFSNYEDKLEIGLVDLNREHVFAIHNNSVIGVAVLFKQENSLRVPLNNVVTLSNIMVNKNFKNNGIATKMIDVLLDDIKLNNKVLNRTKADFEGQLYIFDKIKQKADKKNVLFIPHNLTFVYSKIEQSEKHQSLSDKDKIKLMHDISKKMLEHKTFKEWDIQDIDEVNSSFVEALEDVWKDINKPIKKRKIRKP